MNRALIGVTVVGLALAVTACASMESRTPAQYVEDRQKLMKGHGEAWKNVQDGAKAGNMPAVASNADRMANNATQMVALFPEGSMTEKSKAKPEIWQKWPEFEAAAMNLRTRAEQLRDTAMAKNADGTQAMVKDFGRLACGTCHTPFRVPPPPQPAR
jgi:cytochrome c556